MTCKTLFIFDFDHTLIDTNSDTFFLKQTENELIHELRAMQGPCWTDSVDFFLGKLNELGYSSKQILETLHDCPLSVEMLALIELLEKQSNHRLHILSDANNLFIDSILKFHKIDNCFEKITTNPARIDAKTDRIVVNRFVLADDEPHGCELCPLNLCKGKVLLEWQEELKNGDDMANEWKVVYVGDGRGDLCPALNLQENDLVFVRKKYGLEKALIERSEQQKPAPKAKLVYWNDAADLYKKMCFELNLKELKKIK